MMDQHGNSCEQCCQMVQQVNSSLPDSASPKYGMPIDPQIARNPPCFGGYPPDIKRGNGESPTSRLF